MNKKRLIISYFAIIVFVVIAIGATFTIIEKGALPVHRPVVVSAIPVRLSGGWGYEIEVNHRLYIYQNQVPCLSGKHLFPTRQSAMAVAGIVKRKIMQGQSPSVTKEEIEKAVPSLNN